MRVNGVVLRVEGRFAWVDVAVSQGCGRCNEPGGCGGVNIARPFGASSQAVRVSNEIGVQPGEQVGVLIDDGVPLRAALVAYAFPVLGVLAGAALGAAVASSGSVDLSAGVGAVVGGFAAALFGRRNAALPNVDLPLRLERIPASQAGVCER